MHRWTSRQTPFGPGCNLHIQRAQPAKVQSLLRNNRPPPVYINFALQGWYDVDVILRRRSEEEPHMQVSATQLDLFCPRISVPQTFSFPSLLFAFASPSFAFHFFPVQSASSRVSIKNIHNIQISNVYIALDFSKVAPAASSCSKTSS